MVPSGTETILVVEQDAAVREVIARCLRAQGYRVQSASDDAEALGVARACAPARIDLLLTDVVLPGMSGPSLAAELATVYPDMAVLYISGYRDHTSVGQLHSDEAALMQKPLVLTELGWKVRELLDGCVASGQQEGQSIPNTQPGSILGGSSLVVCDVVEVGDQLQSSR